MVNLMKIDSCGQHHRWRLLDDNSYKCVRCPARRWFNEEKKCWRYKYADSQITLEAHDRGFEGRKYGKKARRTR